jgi:hypothetical protein
MKRNKLFSKKQFGFISGRSTVLQLLQVLEKLTEILDKGGCVDTIYCDFMKAIFAHFQSSGNSPVLFEVSKILAKGVHSDMLTSFSTRGCIPSGSGDFEMFNLSSFLL